jgi:hypothetical protein
MCGSTPGPWRILARAYLPGCDIDINEKGLVNFLKEYTV